MGGRPAKPRSGSVRRLTLVRPPPTMAPTKPPSRFPGTRHAARPADRGTHRAAPDDDPERLRQRRHHRLGTGDPNVQALEDYFAGSGLRAGGSRRRPAGRASSRIEGRDPAAPTLLLMGHTDVVPANPAGWRRDPFGGELVDDIVWGRGATDMLNLTATMAVATRRLAVSDFRPRGTLSTSPSPTRRPAACTGAQHRARARRGPGGLRHHERRRRCRRRPAPGCRSRSARRASTGGGSSSGARRPRLAALPVRQRPGHRRRGRPADRRLSAEGAHPRRLAALRGRRPARPRAGGRADRPERVLDAARRMESLGLAQMAHASTHTTFSPNLVRGGAR